MKFFSLEPTKTSKTAKVLMFLQTTLGFGISVSGTLTQNTEIWVIGFLTILISPVYIGVSIILGDGEE